MHNKFHFLRPAMGVLASTGIVMGSVMGISSAASAEPDATATENASWWHSLSPSADRSAWRTYSHAPRRSSTAPQTTSPSSTTPTTSGTSTSTSTGTADSTQTPTTQAPTSTSTSTPAPTSAPAPTPAAAPASASGVAAPTTDLTGWRLKLSEDFNKNAPLGSFASTYPGWSGYDGGHDTSGNGTYNSATTTSVSGGVLDKNLHTQNGSPQVMALTVPGSAQTYGRYAVRFKTDSIPGYKVAWLLWPSSENWSQGEIDFPEADLDGSVGGFSHDVNGTPSRNAWGIDSGTAIDSGWHTAVVEWTPDRLTFNLDDKSWSTTDRSALPKDPMRWVLQTETSLDGKMPSSSVSGHIDIDWVAMWSRA